VKLLLDTCVWGGAKSILQHAGHDVVWAGDWSSDPGDEQILKVAADEGRVLITLDKDFGELVIVKEHPHGGIVRLVDFAARDQAKVCLNLLEIYGDKFDAGAIVTAEPGRLRIRLGPSES
jgi:predicted nuclease of predicted toxin-antitoxin system